MLSIAKQQLQVLQHNSQLQAQMTTTAEHERLAPQHLPFYDEPRQGQVTGAILVQHAVFKLWSAFFSKNSHKTKSVFV
jgi:hypothetical protein